MAGCQNAQVLWRGEGPGPDVTVLIVLWNCADFLEPCFDSLDRIPESVEVLCYDNASADDSASVAAARGATVIRSATNDGFPHAVNVLLEDVQDGIVLLLNPDVVLARDCLTEALHELEDSSIGVTGANLRRADGRPDPPAARRFRSLTTITLESLGLTRLIPRLDLQYYPSWDRSESRDVECINGAFMLIRRDDLRRIGGLDESVFLYLEDQLLCHDMAGRGRRIRFCAGAVAQHVGGGPTESSAPEQRATAYLHRLDASLEIVHIRQGGAARRIAVIVLLARCSALYVARRLSGDSAGVLKYGSAMRWLLRQMQSRRAPPPVP